jgi:hypothetical protein
MGGKANDQVHLVCLRRIGYLVNDVTPRED